MKHRTPTAAWVSGPVIAIVYLVVAGATFRSGVLPVRPFYEGFSPPQAYRWVNPPSEFAASNQQPDSADETLKLTQTGSQPGNVATNDGQAVFALYAGSVKPASRESAVRIQITPIDPATLGKAPGNLTYDSNAYRIEATYATSGAPAVFASADCPATQQPKTCPTIIIRYARGARELYRRDGASWKPLAATPAESSLQIFADTPGGGIFVAAVHVQGEASKGEPVGTYIALGLGGVAVLAAVYAGVTPRGRRLLRRGKPASKKRPPPKGGKARR